VTSIHGSWADISLQNGGDETGVLVVCYTTSIVYLSTNIVEYLVWNFRVTLNKDLELLSRDHEILIGEGIWDVPTDWSELSSILDDGVEEAETEEESLYWIWLFTSLLVIFPVESLIGTKDVLFKTAWWLQGHLYRVLQDRYWERLGGHGSHPESEISMIAVIKVLDNLLKLGHERSSKMAVHHESPSTSSSVIIDTVLSFLILSSTK